MPLDKTHAIGWDIGIKNLAYCVLEKSIHSTTTNTTANTITNTSANTTNISNQITFNNTRYQITNWADISLLSQITNNLADAGQATSLATKLTCCCPKNDKINAPICSAVASYCHESLSPSGSYRGYCKSHFKKSGITRMPVVPVSKCYHPECTSRATHVLKSHVFTGYCKKHFSEFTKVDSGTRTEADFLKINNVKNAGKIDINQLGVALFQELNKMKSIITNPNVILLENQPVLKNPTMKSMQMFLYSYYLMRILEGNQAKGITGLGEKYIQCYTASKKLDLIKFFPVGEQARISGLLSKVKNGYTRNKKMSILMVEYMLKDNAKWLQFFKGHPKQDDLADSLLMTLHYFERDNLAKLNKAAKKAAIKTPHNVNGSAGGASASAGGASVGDADNSDDENKNDVEEVDSLEAELYEMVVDE
jgi:hypothetical protein